MTEHNAISVALRRITRAIDLHSKVLERTSGLTASQLMLLQGIARYGAVNPSTLARDVHLSHATVTTVLDRLMAAGLVSRVRSDRDRRVVDVSLTEAGRAKLEAAPALLPDGFRKRFDALPDWERTLLLSNLQRIGAMMDDGSVEVAAVAASFETVGPTPATPDAAA